MPAAAAATAAILEAVTDECAAGGRGKGLGMKCSSVIVNTSLGLACKIELTQMANEYAW